MTDKCGSLDFSWPGSTLQVLAAGDSLGLCTSLANCNPGTGHHWITTLLGVKSSSRHDLSQLSQSPRHEVSQMTLVDMSMSMVTTCWAGRLLCLTWRLLLGVGRLL